MISLINRHTLIRKAEQNNEMFIVKNLIKMGNREMVLQLRIIITSDEYFKKFPY